MSDEFENKILEFLALGHAARSQLFVQEGGFTREQLGIPKLLGHSLTMACQSRCVELFDDCETLLMRSRLPSPATLARALLETIGFMTLLHEHTIASLPSNPDGFAQFVVEMANSSSFKTRIQKEGPRDGEIYTEEALLRFGQPRTKPIQPTQHAIGALEKYLNTGVRDGAGSVAWENYSSLCEWAHPSQASLMGAYTSLGDAVPSSYGLRRPLEFSRFTISWALAQLWIVPQCRDEIISRLKSRFEVLGITIRPQIRSNGSPVMP